MKNDAVRLPYNFSFISVKAILSQEPQKADYKLTKKALVSSPTPSLNISASSISVALNIPHSGSLNAGEISRFRRATLRCFFLPQRAILD